MNNSAEEIWDRISKAKNILHVMDSRFDFDALCSALFLTGLIKEKLGKDVEIIYPSRLAESAAKHFDVSKIKQETDVSTVDLSAYDLINLCDSGDIGHITEKDDFQLPDSIEVVNIDHHSSNERYGTFNYVKVIGSTCTVLYQFASELDIELNNEQMRLLTFGMLTDTGFMKYSTTTADDLNMLSYFLEKGLDYKEIIQELEMGLSWDEMMHRKIIYSNLKMGSNPRYAYSSYTLDELNSEGIDLTKVVVRHTDNIKYLGGVDFVFTVTEKTKGVYSVSFRSSDLDFDVSELAVAMGGGGHKVAAAATLEADSIEEAIETTENKLAELLK